MREETLVRDLMKHQRVLRALLLALVGNADVADDLLQEAALIMARKREGVSEDVPFLAWAKAICVNLVRDHRKKSRRQRVFLLSDGNIESVATAFVEAEPEMWQSRRKALHECIGELEPHHRELITRRYNKKEAVESLAASLSRTRQAVDTMLCRLRGILATCVERRIRGWEVVGERDGRA